MLNLESTAHQHTFNIIQQFMAYFSKNINNLKYWIKLLRQNKKFSFQQKTPLPPNQCSLKSFRHLTTKLYQIQH